MENSKTRLREAVAQVERTDMNTRIASYSKLVKAGKKLSGKAIREAYAAGTAFDLELTDFGPDCGRYTSPQELKKLGHKSVWIRYNADRDIMELKL